MTRKIADEVFLVPVKGELAQIQKMFVLNAVGECIWDYIGEPRTREQIVGAVVSAFEVEEAVAGMDVEEFLENLRTAGLVEEL